MSAKIVTSHLKVSNASEPHHYDLKTYSQIIFKMARTRAKDYHQKKAFIREKAVELFAEQGFSNSSITQLSGRCGASKAWLYHYFNSKEEILFEIFDIHTSRLVEAIKNVRELGLAPEEQFQKFLQNFLKIYESTQTTHLVLLHDLNRLNPEQHEIIAARERTIVQEIAEMIAVLRPDLLGHQPELQKPLAMSLMGMINWTFTWFRKEGPMSHKQFSQLAAQLFLHGIIRLNLQASGD